MIPDPHTEDAAVRDGRPEGMVDYECRVAIRDVLRTYGRADGRQVIAFILDDEMNRRHRRGDQ